MTEKAMIQRNVYTLNKKNSNDIAIVSIFTDRI